MTSVMVVNGSVVKMMFGVSQHPDVMNNYL